jgi:hypothetical protein
MAENLMEDLVKHITAKHGEETWVPLYKWISKPDKSEDGSYFCALVSKDASEEAMESSDWDLMLRGGGPTFITSYEDGEPASTYHERSDEEFRRLVIGRDFHGRKDNYFEISEEFRLFHNLYFDAKKSVYSTFDDSGDELEVVKVTEEEILVRKSYLKSFMAASQMNFLLYFEITRHFVKPERFEQEHVSSNLNYVIFSGSSYVKGYHSFVRLRGKKLINCEALEECGVFPFEKPKKFESFAIGGDVDGPVEFSCNPAHLADYFGANPEASNYLTPIFFKKEVMQKYYGSSEYEIQDSMLYRKGAWSLRFDNHHSNHISVFLGDLGSDLPHKEQLYWKSFNIVPDGHEISETNFQRSFMGAWCDTTAPDLLFKSEFRQLQTSWHEKYGWDLFLPMSEKDEHFFTSIRSMLTNEQSEFDGQILSLAKVTIDSANVKSLLQATKKTDAEGKSIILFGEMFKLLDLEDVEGRMAFLRGVQSVRSSGVAHRKGTLYEKTIAKLNIDADNYKAEFDSILSGFSKLFADIRAKLGEPIVEADAVLAKVPVVPTVSPEGNEGRSSSS